MGLYTKVSLQLFNPQPTPWHVGTLAIDVCSIDVPLHAHTISKHHSVSPAVHTLASILKHMCIACSTPYPHWPDRCPQEGRSCWALQQQSVDSAEPNVTCSQQTGASQTAKKA
jgi:hypothetical protein